MKVPMTTIMLRNVPHKYTQDTLFNEIMAVLDGAVDVNFVYLPWDSQNECNPGFAFINCCDPGGATRCRELFNGYYFSKSAKRTACAVFMAHIQGLEGNLLHLMGSNSGGLGKHAPIVIWQGHRLNLGRVIAAMRNLPDPPPRVHIATPNSDPGRAACGSQGQHGWQQFGVASPHRQPPASTGAVDTHRWSGLAWHGGCYQQGPATDSTCLPLSGGPSNRQGGPCHSGAGVGSGAGCHSSGPEIGGNGEGHGSAEASFTRSGDAFGRSVAEASLAQRMRNLMVEKGIPMHTLLDRRRRDKGVPDHLDLDQLFAGSQPKVGGGPFATCQTSAANRPAGAVEQDRLGNPAQMDFGVPMAAERRRTGQMPHSLDFARDQLSAAGGPRAACRGQARPAGDLAGVAEPPRSAAASQCTTTHAGPREGFAVIDLSQVRLHDRAYSKFLQTFGGPDSGASGDAASCAPQWSFRV